jgi:hypothetical protein
MEMSGQLHTPACLNPWTGCPESTRQEAVWVSRAGLTLWRRETFAVLSADPWFLGCRHFLSYRRERIKETGNKEPTKNDRNAPELHLCHTVRQQGPGCLHVHHVPVLCKNLHGTWALATLPHDTDPQTSLWLLPSNPLLWKQITSGETIIWFTKLRKSKQLLFQ